MLKLRAIVFATAPPQNCQKHAQFLFMAKCGRPVTGWRPHDPRSNQPAGARQSRDESQVRILPVPRRSTSIRRSTNCLQHYNAINQIDMKLHRSRSNLELLYTCSYSYLIASTRSLHALYFTTSTCRVNIRVNMRIHLPFIFTRHVHVLVYVIYWSNTGHLIIIQKDKICDRRVQDISAAQLLIAPTTIAVARGRTPAVKCLRQPRDPRSKDPNACPLRGGSR